MVSTAYVKSPTARIHNGLSAGSYQDMTRVARLNEYMWTDLLMENGDNLVRELDFFMDTELVKAAGMPIPDFFAQRGEAAFRALETEVLREFSKRSGLVIATGGGVVTRAENRDLLRQNSTVVFLEREDVRALPKAGRPVSQVRPIEQLAAERLPLYRAWCDVTVRGVDPQTNAKNILEAVSA